MELTAIRQPNNSHELLESQQTAYGVVISEDDSERRLIGFPRRALRHLPSAHVASKVL